MKKRVSKDFSPNDLLSELTKFIKKHEHEYFNIQEISITGPYSNGYSQLNIEFYLDSDNVIDSISKTITKRSNGLISASLFKQMQNDLKDENISSENTVFNDYAMGRIGNTRFKVIYGKTTNTIFISDSYSDDMGGNKIVAVLFLNGKPLTYEDLPKTLKITGETFSEIFNTYNYKKIVKAFDKKHVEAVIIIDDDDDKRIGKQISLSELFSFFENFEEDDEEED